MAQGPTARPMTGTPPPGTPRVQTRITVPDQKIMVNLLGAGDEILRLVERSVNSDVHVRGNEITITGAPADNALAERLFSELLELIEKGETLTTDAVRRTVGMLEQGGAERPAEVLTLNILSRRGRTIRPKTLGQKKYVDAIDAHTIVFGIGPAGTGKTYLAMAKAVQALQAKQVNRIILTRPAVEAGERLGFLPGTLNEKIDPYLRPLYDALHDMLDPETIPKLMAAGHDRGRAAGIHARAGAAVRRPGADPGGLPAVRLAPGRRPGHRLERDAHAGDRHLPAGAEADLPGHHAGRRVHALLRRAPVDRAPRRTTSGVGAGARSRRRR